MVLGEESWYGWAVDGFIYLGGVLAKEVDSVKRGTTPTNTFKTNIDLTGSTVFITYSQAGRVMFEKSGDSLEINSEAVVTRLTQKDTVCVNAKFLLYFFRSHDNDLLSGHSISNGDFVPVKTFLKIILIS